MNSTYSHARERAGLSTLVASAGLLSIMAFAAPAFADINSSTISVSTDSSGQIESVTTARAVTGNNWAGGSQGGAGGSGGTVSGGSGSGNNGGAVGGDGGSGGMAGDGGYVQTGDATADAGSFASLNATDVGIGVDGNINSSTISVASTNTGDITNTTRAVARTGGNSADGVMGGMGSDGGAVSGDGGSGNNGGAMGGMGGTGADTGIGGTVTTGASNVTSGSISVMNAVLVRVNRN